MTIVCTITVSAEKDVYFATHRIIYNEYGELLKAYCPTRIEIDVNAKTILVKTKMRGTAVYTFSNFRVIETGAGFYDVKGNLMAVISFADNYSGFRGLKIFGKDDTFVIYFKTDDKKLKAIIQ